MDISLPDRSMIHQICTIFQILQVVNQTTLKLWQSVCQSFFYVVSFAFRSG